jgi:hypothetical protein
MSLSTTTTTTTTTTKILNKEIEGKKACEYLLCIALSY